MRAIATALLSAAALLSACVALGQGSPTVVWQTVSSGGGGSGGGAVSVQATLGQPLAHGAAAVDPMIGGGYWRAPLRDSDEIACGMLAGQSNVFHQTRLVTVAVEGSGPGTLHCLRATRTDAQHPQWVPGIDASAYWTLTSFDTSGLPASGYSLALTFPQPGLGNPFACRWSGLAWQCGQTSFDLTTVTRAGVTTLSDWVVASQSVPVELIHFTAD
ncbi:MAG: hypothetical protein ABIT01_14315 [Thermoanaerobaculia bacterium]